MPVYLTGDSQTASFFSCSIMSVRVITIVSMQITCIMCSYKKRKKIVFALSFIDKARTTF